MRQIFKQRFDKRGRIRGNEQLARGKFRIQIHVEFFDCFFVRFDQARFNIGCKCGNRSHRQCRRRMRRRQFAAIGIFRGGVDINAGRAQRIGCKRCKCPQPVGRFANRQRRRRRVVCHQVF